MKETVAYIELPEHEYVHVTTTGFEGQAKFSREDNKTGKLVIESHAGDFEPSHWNFIKGVEPGVYRRDELNVELLPNMEVA